MPNKTFNGVSSLWLQMVQLQRLVKLWSILNLRFLLAEIKKKMFYKANWVAMLISSAY